MDKTMRKKIALIKAIAACDREYVSLMEQLRKEERVLGEREYTMTPQQRDAVWDYIDTCEEISMRLLELACIHMHFPGE